ncbi:MAG: hypothetical protein NVS4B11_09830 [Ktedonobacteraceae bacterium]
MVSPCFPSTLVNPTLSPPPPLPPPHKLGTSTNDEPRRVEEEVGGFASVVGETCSTTTVSNTPHLITRKKWDIYTICEISNVCYAVRNKKDTTKRLYL